VPGRILEKFSKATGGVQAWMNQMSPGGMPGGVGAPRGPQGPHQGPWFGSGEMGISTEKFIRKSG